MLFWKFLENHRHGLLPIHINKLAGMCSAFTGHDIEKLVQKALLWPSQKVMDAKYFTRVPNPFYCLNKDCTSYHPCHKNSSGATAMTIDYLLDYLSDYPCLPLITLDDMVHALRDTPRTIKEDDLKKMSKFSLEMNKPLRQNSLTMQKPSIEPVICHQAEITLLWQMKFVLLNSANLSQNQIFWRKQKFKLFKISSNQLAKSIVEQLTEKEDEHLAVSFIRWINEFDDYEQLTHLGAEHKKIHLSVHDVVEKICQENSLQGFEFAL